METLVDHVKTLAKSCDAKTRREMLDQLQSLCHSIESSDDTIQRISFLNWQLAGLRIGADWKLFNILSESSNPLTIDQISKRTKADAVLLGMHRALEYVYNELKCYIGRILRYPASLDAIQEVDKDTFTANNVCKTLATTGAQAPIHH